MATPEPLIDLDSARELLRRVVPTWEELLEELELSGGRLKFRPEMNSTISNLKIDNYWVFRTNVTADSGIVTGDSGERDRG